MPGPARSAAASSAARVSAQVSNGVSGVIESSSASSPCMAELSDTATTAAGPHAVTHSVRAARVALATVWGSWTLHPGRGCSSGYSRTAVARHADPRAKADAFAAVVPTSSPMTTSSTQATVRAGPGGPRRRNYAGRVSILPGPDLPPLVRLADGTVKQVNPLTGTQVWTVPGRAGRPLPTSTGAHLRIDPAQHGQHCAFCEGRYLDTPPEKARLVRVDGQWQTVTGLTAEQLDDTVAEFRIVPNLFEIVSVDYWRLNHGHRPSSLVEARRAAYLATAGGQAHVARLQQVRQGSGAAPSSVDGLFGGFHDVVVARRHFVDGARCEDELASSGTLTPEEHRYYIEFTVRAIRDMFDADPLVANVAVFQNWLRPAGASFDHLHKQLVGIDTLGRRREQEIWRLEADHDLFRRAILDVVAEHGLIVAENEHAVAFAGIGHRYPSLEVWSKRDEARPWELTPEELGGWSDMLHACHAATGSAVPSNEEWHYRPPSLDLPMPLRAVLKWRISTLAGFEGGTRIYINTIDPWTLRDRARASLTELLAAGVLAAGVRLAD